MGRKWYGSINNRIEEGRNYEPDEKIKVGTGITVYCWSDRQCKYVTKVIDQKHIFVKDYYVIADRAFGSYSDRWKYFKSLRDREAYLNDWYRSHPEGAAEYERIMGRPYEYADLDEIEEPSHEEEWAFRYGHWNRVTRFDKALAEKIEEGSGWRGFRPKTKKEKEAFEAGKEVVRYDRIQEGISFGVRDYRYDWEF